MQTIKEENIDLQQNIVRSIEQIMKEAAKAIFKDPKESAFLLKFAAAGKKAAVMRMKAEEKGEHIPGFLIASVTSSCNLHCAGCYSRCIETTTDDTPSCQLTGEEWLKVFREADELGISFVLLAGGEPLIRRDIIEAAGTVGSVVFPIITNGTMIDDAYLELFDRCRNLVPVLSIEGEQQTTDLRRGEGIYDLLLRNMDEMKKRHLMFGASITVTTENIKEVMSRDYVEGLREKGVRMVFFIEFVPVADDAAYLAPQEKDREYMTGAMTKLRQAFPNMILLSFPGDEDAMGGCLAAGRGFFHINSHGGAEPCPFSPFSDINVKNASLKEALNTELFRMIRAEGLLTGSHTGGCVLYEKRDQVEALLRNQCDKGTVLLSHFAGKT